MSAKQDPNQNNQNPIATPPSPGSYRSKSIYNSDNDVFLFCYIPSNLEIDFCCGCSLKSGVKIISLIFLLAGFSGVLTALKAGSLLDTISSISIITVYFIAGGLLFYSTLGYQYIYAYVAYLLYATILILNFLDVVVMSILMYLGIYSPLGNQSNFVNGTGFLMAGMIILAIFVYMIWVVFSYAIHLKLKRVDLVNGDYSNIDFGSFGQSPRTILF